MPTCSLLACIVQSVCEEWSGRLEVTEILATLSVGPGPDRAAVEKLIGAKP